MLILLLGLESVDVGSIVTDNNIYKMEILMVGFSFTEMQKKSNGGTEQVCRMIEKNIPQNLLNDFQIIPSRVSTLEEDKIRVYFLHDLPQDPETNHLQNESSRDRFHKIVFCGNWQYNQYLNILGVPPTNKLIVIDTPIEPIELIEKLLISNTKTKLISADSFKSYLRFF